MTTRAPKGARVVVILSSCLLHYSLRELLAIIAHNSLYYIDASRYANAGAIEL